MTFVATIGEDGFNVVVVIHGDGGKRGGEKQWEEWETDDVGGFHFVCATA